MRTLGMSNNVKLVQFIDNTKNNPERSKKNSAASMQGGGKAHCVEISVGGHLGKRKRAVQKECVGVN